MTWSFKQLAFFCRKPLLQEVVSNLTSECEIENEESSYPPTTHTVPSSDSTMVHSLCTRLFSLLRANEDQCSCRIMGQDSDSEAQMVVDMESSCAPCDSRILVTNNNNYRVLCADEKSDNSPSRWSSPDNWTRASPESLERVTSKPSGTCWVRAVLTSVVILVTLLIVAFAIVYFRPISVHRTISNSTNPPSTATFSPTSTRTIDSSARYSDREYKKRVSRLTFKQLKSSPPLDANGKEQREDGLVLPASMVFTSAKNKELGEKSKNCCQMEKYSQVISSAGCESVTIINRKCSGTCKAVWIPGIFESFPVCSPSRTKWKSVTLICGQDRNRRKRVRVERIKRCSCMESQSTTPESTPTPES